MKPVLPTPPTTIGGGHKQIDNDNGIHPLYPTTDGRPSKGGYEGVKPLDKPQKKPAKGDKDKDKYAGPFAPSAPSHTTKYEFANYDDDDDVDDEDRLRPHHRPAQSNGPGPGFFNPSATKNQFPDYDQGLYHNGASHQQRPSHTAHGPGGSGNHNNNNNKPNAFNPFVVQQPGSDGIEHDKLPPELFNILGGNAQNIPPHLRIEHLLQQIQGGAGGSDTNGNDGGQGLFGGSQGFPFGQQHSPGSGVGGGQQVATRPSGGPGKVIRGFGEQAASAIWEGMAAT